MSYMVVIICPRTQAGIYSAKKKKLGNSNVQRLSEGGVFG
jgi:hypothetical protein